MLKKLLLHIRFRRVFNNGFSLKKFFYRKLEQDEKYNLHIYILDFL